MVCVWVCVVASVCGCGRRCGWVSVSLVVGVRQVVWVYMCCSGCEFGRGCWLWVFLCVCVCVFVV